MPQQALSVRAWILLTTWSIVWRCAQEPFSTRVHTRRSLCFHSFRSGRGKRGEKKALYLCDEDAVLLHQVVVVVTPRQQLPHLSPQGLGDPAPHQRRQRLGPHAQVEVPGCAQRDGYYSPNTNKRAHEQQLTCTAKHVKWQEFQDSPYVARLSEIQARI